jgi:WW domain-containing oxidoreductase
MTCRTLAKGNAARKAIVEELIAEGHGIQPSILENRLVPMELELGSLASVKAFADTFLEKFGEQGLHSLVLNAGIMNPPFGLTTDGVEQQFGVNHLAHFFLAKLLTPVLKKAQPSTVVVVASNAQFLAHREGVHLTLEDINDKTKYDPIQAYGQSKLSNVIFAQELAARFAASGDQIFVNSLNPGGVNTNLFREYPSFVQKLLKLILSTLPDTFIFEPDTAALTSLFAAVSPKVMEGRITGTYLVPIGDTCEPSDHAKNSTLQRRLWEFSEETLKLKGF